MKGILNTRIICFEARLPEDKLKILSTVGLLDTLKLDSVIPMCLFTLAFIFSSFHDHGKNCKPAKLISEELQLVVQELHTNRFIAIVSKRNRKATSVRMSSTVAAAVSMMIYASIFSEGYT